MGLSKSSKDVIRDSWYLSLGLNSGRHEHQVMLNIRLQRQIVKCAHRINPYPANVDNMASSYQC